MDKFHLTLKDILKSRGAGMMVSEIDLLISAKKDEEFDRVVREIQDTILRAHLIEKRALWGSRSASKVVYDDALRYWRVKVQSMINDYTPVMLKIIPKIYEFHALKSKGVRVVRYTGSCSKQKTIRWKMRRRKSIRNNLIIFEDIVG